jgi:hypothetical protein
VLGYDDPILQLSQLLGFTMLLLSEPIARLSNGLLPHHYRHTSCPTTEGDALKKKHAAEMHSARV